VRGVVAKRSTHENGRAVRKASALGFVYRQAEETPVSSIEVRNTRLLKTVKRFYHWVITIDVSDYINLLIRK
jgi:hypothetical protein